MIKLKTTALINKIGRHIDVYLFGKGGDNLQNRKGLCHRCGLCCKILFKCPFYVEKYPFGECSIYEERSKVCRLFPMSEKDIRIVKECGYYFENNVDKVYSSALKPDGRKEGILKG
jgi:hypothetical protein